MCNFKQSDSAFCSNYNINETPPKVGKAFLNIRTSLSFLMKIRGKTVSVGNQSGSFYSNKRIKQYVLSKNTARLILLTRFINNSLYWGRTTALIPKKASIYCRHAQKVFISFQLGKKLV